MGFKSVYDNLMVVKNVRALRASPREMIANRHLLFTAAVYAMSGIPISKSLPFTTESSLDRSVAAWDQGSSSVVPSLPSFEKKFNISSGSNAAAISNFVSLVYIGCGVGAALSFFLNDRVGRLWSFRIYTCVWIVGQMIATGSNSMAALYLARIVSGLGIGALTVIGPVSLVEISPREFRGLITVWFSVAMLLSLFIAVLCVYGVLLHVDGSSDLQYQIAFFSPCIFMAGICAASFWCHESPRWLYLVDRKAEALDILTALRGLGPDHPRVSAEADEIEIQIQSEQSKHGSGSLSTSWSGIKFILRETFLVPANLRRVQQALISYALAQMSGANTVTSYFVPILKILGQSSDQAHSLFLSSMYSMAKFFFTLMASFFFIDALGRRTSLFVGVTIQMISDFYLGVFIKYKQAGDVSQSASEAAMAMIFLHGFGYAIGLLVLPYVFGAELWPNSIRSFGSALSQTFHWLFFFAMQKAFPPLLSETHNWGAFIFFGAWCLLSLVYVYLVVPETAGESLEGIDELFSGPWYMAYRTSKKQKAKVIEGSTGAYVDGDGRASGQTARSLDKGDIRPVKAAEV